VKITINGEQHVIEGQINVAQLLVNLELNPKKIAVEQNLAIVPLSEYESTAIMDGDNIEIVNFIGGG
jgi:thiamine biosynthesis protein ThiS